MAQTADLSRKIVLQWDSLQGLSPVSSGLRSGCGRSPSVGRGHWLGERVLCQNWVPGSPGSTHISSFNRRYWLYFLIYARLWGVLGIMVFKADVRLGEKMVRKASLKTGPLQRVECGSKNAEARFSFQSLNLTCVDMYIHCMSCVHSCSSICSLQARDTALAYHEHTSWCQKGSHLELMSIVFHVQFSGDCCVCVEKPAQGNCRVICPGRRFMLIASMGIFLLYHFCLFFQKNNEN